MIRIRRRQLGEWIAAYILLSPYLFVFLVFSVFAIAYAFYLSFTYFDLFSPPRWIGLGNYLYLLRDNLFLQKAVPNTLKYVAVVVPVQTAISLLLAFAMDQEIKFRRFFRTLFYVPSVTSSVVISLIFLWLFKKTGVINQLLGLSIDWLTSPTFALPTIMIVNIWATTGTMMVIFLAGLQDIPVTYYEAAMIDGANRWQMLRHITIPLLRPVIFFVVTMGVIGCFQVFDQIYVMTAGGPLDSTTTIAYLIYKWAFQSTTPFMGRASAVAFVLAGMILIVTVIQRRLIERPTEV
ncbi:carbohydrate ABC transporter permease [Thermoflexus sp.]|uniref:carbohydrate ABC transporter permease n=1 Tax=Thermoflexus sp. TaxID=1969742 RepID=UPI0025F9E707|nr:sugar ABC transporter permease [Thermoflexus sp.]MDW8065198.1 sugar ABC transporter permease [Anaerolineae bacterium]MCS6963777.1 sugar ABC transporter permease [Thermoflexus sp.]MCS7350767.1 sugar ABC transporter permease [Thermoflexus sp.]MDW8180218.1 sugar ABC transporter permease [Anaerolineae bacterium]MDW8185112.1 sugar ABC transporter permease [Anaerolineae bacterium]